MLINNIKIIAQTTEPNPREVDYWINTSVDPNGGLIMFHDGKAWHPVNEHHDLFQEELIKQEVERAKAAEDTIEDAVGLNDDGTFKEISGNYTNDATSIVNAIQKVDEAVKNVKFNSLPKYDIMLNEGNSLPTKKEDGDLTIPYLNLAKYVGEDAPTSFLLVIWNYNSSGLDGIFNEMWYRQIPVILYCAFNGFPGMSQFHGVNVTNGDEYILMSNQYQGYGVGQIRFVKNGTKPSSTTTISVASLPITSNLVVATISAAGSFSLTSTPDAGKEIHVIIKNTATSDVTVTLPTASPYVCISSDSLTVPASGYAEVNAISDGTNIYLRAL